MDTTRFTAAGFTPRWSSSKALAELVDAASPGPLRAERVEGALGALGRWLADTGTSRG